ncbi:uncharacterized protein G2W53_020828 [Senna tora]|uniref:REJ domain-containing protein n=1 Tax=Senna tora TaxID=362788 RepID=A0A834TKB6_9FABA|nr:uncharacterized protein G2W53_020828 [Senna tora]
MNQASSSSTGPSSVLYPPSTAH